MKGESTTKLENGTISAGLAAHFFYSPIPPLCADDAPDCVGRLETLSLGGFDERSRRSQRRADNRRYLGGNICCTTSRLLPTPTRRTEPSEAGGQLEPIRRRQGSRTKHGGLQ